MKENENDSIMKEKGNDSIINEEKYEYIINPDFISDGVYKYYNIKFTLINDSLFVTIIYQDSQRFESETNITNLKKNKLFESLKDTDIINYLYFCLMNDDSYINLYESYLKFTLNILSSPYFFLNSLNNHSNEFGNGKCLTKKIFTYMHDTKEFILEKNENKLEFICKKKDKSSIDLISLYEFFTCIKCKEIVSNAYSCNCPKFICFKCLKKYSNNECSFNKNEEIDYVVSNIFEHGKIKKDKINFYILKQRNFKNLYLKKELKTIISPDFNFLTPKGTLDLIGNLTADEITEQFKTFENDLTPCNILDLISTIGSLVNNYINDIRKASPKHFIDISKALLSKKDSPLFISGIMAKFLSNQGINVAIEEKSSCKTLTKSLLNWLMIGLLKFKKIVLHLDYGETKNNQILENAEEQKKIFQYWKDKISEKIKNIYLLPISIKKGSIELCFAVINDNDDDIDDLSSSLDTLSEYEEIKDIKYKMLLEGCLISCEMFDTKWNNSGYGWAPKGEKRGGAIYDPPREFDGYGLKVSKQYDNSDDTWLGMKNIEGEWWVAYHGAGRHCSDEQIKRVIKNIVENGFISGHNQKRNLDRNINPKSNREYEGVGDGVYLTYKISEAEGYAGIVKDEEGNKYKIVFMCRVCPQKVRIAELKPDYFVLDPNTDCVRPYRILLKKPNNSFCVIY